MKHIYYFNIDTICNECGFRNIINRQSDIPIQIAACGDCGTILYSKENVTDSQKESTQLVIDEIVKEKGKE